MLISDSVECLWSSVHSRVCRYSREVIVYETGNLGLGEGLNIGTAHSVISLVNLDMTYDIYLDVHQKPKPNFFDC